MPDPKSSQSEPPDETPQALVGYSSNEEWNALLQQVDGLVQKMDDLPYPEVKENIFALLAGIDAIHREGLHRLVRLFKEGVLEQVVTDPAIHTLMEMYDLLPPEARIVDDQASKVEWSTNSAPAPTAVEPEPPTAPPPRKPLYAHWVPVLQSADEFPDGSVKECMVDDRRILLCRAKGGFFAIESACVRGDASLAEATLVKYTLTCPNHRGCYYDIRNGGHIAGKTMLECYPVKQDEKGRVLIGLGMDFKPELPAF